MGKVAAAELLRKIESAFAGVTLGDGLSLNMIEYEDSGGLATEFNEAALHDERKDWRIIPGDVLEKSTVTFCFTDWQGFRFYLPAYMSWTIRHPNSDRTLGNDTICALDPDWCVRGYKKPMNEMLTAA